MQTTNITEEEHYRLIRVFGRRHGFTRLECKYCEYVTNRSDFMLRHLSKEHKAIIDKEA